MAVNRFGKDDTLQGFDMYKDLKYYALFEERNKDPNFSYENNEEGRKLFLENLAVIERIETATVYVLKFYNDAGKKGIITSVTPCSGSFKFQMKEYDRSLAAAGIGRIQPTSGSDFVLFLKEERDRLMYEVAELRQENDELRAELDEANEAPKGDGKGLGIIGTIGKAGNEFPWMQEPIKELMANVKDLFTAGKFKMRQAASGLGAVDPAAAEADTEISPDDLMNKSIKQITGWYIRNESGLSPAQFQALDEEAKGKAREAGFTRFAYDMAALASLTKDDDMMRLVLKKLRDNAA